MNPSGRIDCASFPSAADGWAAGGWTAGCIITPSACSSKLGLPQIRFDIVQWRPLETSKPPPSGLLDEHIAGSVPLSILVVARE